MPATGAEIGTPASMSASVLPQTLAIEVEPFELTTSETSRIVYGNSSALGNHGKQRPLGEGAVTDVAAAGAAQAPHFTDAEWREVVMVDVALAIFRADRIEPLLLGGRAKRHDGDDLRLTTGEDRRAVGARKVASLDPDRSDLVGAPAIGARAVVEGCCCAPLPSGSLRTRP